MATKILLGSEDFFSALKNDIGQAKQRIWIQCLTFEADRAGNALANAILENSEALDRRLLVDEYTKYVINDRFLYSLSARKDRALQKEKIDTHELLLKLSREGCKTRWTNPIGFFIHRMPARNHKKILIIDDVAYIGGFNFSDHNFDWHDVMLRIDDPIWVKALAEDFEVSWDERPSQKGYQALPKGGLLLFPGQSRSREETEILLKVFSEAKKSIFIESPYLSEPIFSILKQQAAKGIQVDLVLPNRNNWALYDDYTRAALADSKIQVHFYPRMTHLKAALIDETQLWIGSANFEYFGLHLHQELLACFNDPSLIREFIDRIITPDIAASVMGDTSSFRKSKTAKWRVEFGFRLFHALNRVF